MKLTKIFAALFGLLGLALAVCSVWAGFTFRNSDPILLTPPKDAQKTVDTMLSEACSGNYTSASQRILGNPRFGMDFTPDGPIEEMIWQEFCGSFSYELVGDCFVTEDGLGQHARISYLDLDSITANLKDRVQELLEERIANAESVDELYNENNEFKESFVMEALQDTVEEAIANNARIVTVDVTVNMIWRDDRWWILSNDALLSALSGGIAK